MSVGDEDMELPLLALHHFGSEFTDAAAGVENEFLLAVGDAEAARISSVPQKTSPRRGRGSPGAPKGEAVAPLVEARFVESGLFVFLTASGRAGRDRFPIFKEGLHFLQKN